MLHLELGVREVETKLCSVKRMTQSVKLEDLRSIPSIHVNKTKHTKKHVMHLKGQR